VDQDEMYLLSAAERELKRRFSVVEANRHRLPSTATDAAGSDRIDQLVLPDEMRAKMPLTADKYIVRESPELVQWEREVRKFVQKTPSEHGRRVAAVMIYEWATGMRIVDIMAAAPERLPPGKQNWRTDLRKINRILRWYFGDPYSTYICGRKVPKTYKVNPGWMMRTHRPMTLTLYAEWVEGVLNP
jgi:hypothetical protein